VLNLAGALGRYNGKVEMNKPADDLEAVRTVVEAVQGFTDEEQQRIFRWAGEKLGLRVPSSATRPAPQPGPAAPEGSHVAAQPPAGGGQDIRSFVAAKQPRSDVQYAATVAYYHQFEAPQAEKKERIGKDDLQEAARKTGRERFKRPDQTLRNAHSLGLLDKGDEAGTFCINTVGENLVAMTLPGNGTTQSKRAKKSATKARGEVAKNAVRKKGPGKRA
jgi:hypothetical protein